MSATIITKNSSTASAIPAAGSLVQGELAVNVTDKKLYTKDSSGTVQKLVGSLGNQEASAVAITGGTESGVAITGGTINNTPIGATTASTVRGTVVTATTNFVGDLTGNVTGNTSGTHTGAVTGNVTGDLTGNVTASSGTSSFNNVTINGTLDMNSGSAGTITGLATPSASSDAANKGYVDTAISNLIGTAPSTLDTLGEIADALNDDANIAATLTAQIAAKVSKSGDSMTGALAMGSNKITGLGTPTASTDAATKGYVDTADATKLNLSGGTMTGNIVMGANKVTSTATPTTDDDLTRKAYVDSILGSATSAATSASAAATSATNAANSASSASSSATNAANSYTAANTAASNAQSFATSASNSATSASTSASTATTQASNAASSASAAANSATNAANSASAASTSATSAGSSATSAAASASSASTSATSASSSASSALTSANNAATSANLAANSYDSFDDRYLGAKASAPTLDNDGNALLEGALYWNTTSKDFWVWNGTAWTQATLTSAGFVTLAGTETLTNKTFASPTVVSVNSSSAALRVTQTGSGNSLVVEDSTNPDSTPFVVDTVGNVGVGVTPSAWSAVSNAVEVGYANGTAALIQSSSDGMWLVSNAYFNGTNWIYKKAGTASTYSTFNGEHRWNSAASSTSGSTLTWSQTMTLDIDGKLGLGVTVPIAKFDLAGDYKEGVISANTGTAYTISITSGTVQILTLTGNCTFTFPTATAGRSFILILKQDATGSRTVTWPAAVKWPAGTAPTITSTASKADKYVFTADGTNWIGSNAGQNYTV